MPMNTADELQRRLSSVMSSDRKANHVGQQVQFMKSKNTIGAEPKLPRSLFNDLDIHQKLEI